MARTIFTGAAFGNFGFKSGADLVGAAQNRETLARKLSLEKIIFMEQTHGNQVIQVNSATNELQNSDAIITCDFNIGLAVLTADCLPILVNSNKAVAAIHAGRKGLTNSIIENTIIAMLKLGAQNLEAKIGPAICASCYEVDEGMYSELTANFPAMKTDPQAHSLDLATEAVVQLRGLGVKVGTGFTCTKESEDFYSYRRSSETGRQVGVISL